MRRLLQLGAFCLALIGLGSGCIVETSDTVVQEGGGGAPSEPINDGAEGWSTGSPTSPGPWGGGPCGYQAYTFPMPDGTETVLILPLECDPFWFDTGDPPPESNPFDEHGQPPAGEGVLHEEQQFSH